MKRILIIMILVLSIQAYGQNNKSVNTELLNIRAGAGQNYAVVGQVKQSETVKVISETNNWTQIETENGVKGYVSSNFLSDTKEENKKNKGSIWETIVLVCGLILYLLFKGYSSIHSKQKKLAKEPILRWYHCGICQTTLKHNKTPTNSNRSCLNKDYHKWQELGKVGNKSYQCNRCSTIVQTINTPSGNNWSCLGNDYHRWTKL